MEDIVRTPECILDERIQKGVKHYLIKWAGVNIYGDSWELTW
ncbi:10227_t:CDS:1, partial [Entrophospora sp. SA101]